MPIPARDTVTVQSRQLRQLAPGCQHRSKHLMTHGRGMEGGRLVLARRHAQLPRALLCHRRFGRGERA
jgi:hypothetical protein